MRFLWFHTVGYKNHSVGYIFHTVKYISRSMKQRNVREISENINLTSTLKRSISMLLEKQLLHQVKKFE